MREGTREMAIEKQGEYTDKVKERDRVIESRSDIYTMGRQREDKHM